VQIIMSQLPNLEAAWWASAIGAIMSFGYSAIAIALGAREAHNGLGSLTGKPAAPTDKLFGCFNALGNFGFAYSCAIVLMEVQVRFTYDSGLTSHSGSGLAAASNGFVAQSSVMAVISAGQHCRGRTVSCQLLLQGIQVNPATCLQEMRMWCRLYCGALQPGSACPGYASDLM
jgi:hypothetical protein